MRTPHACFTVLLGLAPIACDDGAADGAEAEVKEAAQDALEDASPSKKKGVREEKQDKGSAKVAIGTSSWEAERCSARKKGSTLRLACSRTDMKGKAISRQELRLVVADYTGPGDYTVGQVGSMFVGVGFDAQQVEAATDNDADTTLWSERPSRRKSERAAAPILPPQQRGHEVVGETATTAPASARGYGRGGTDRCDVKPGPGATRDTPPPWVSGMGCS